MRQLKSFLCIMLAFLAAGLLSASAAQAAITMAGNVEPTTDPFTWISGYSSTPGITTAYVGNTSNGSLTIDGGSSLNSFATYLGYTAGVTGSTVIAGSGSTWTNKAGNFFVGEYGIGVVDITNGGTLATNGFYTGHYAGSSGTVHIDGSGSSVTSSGTFLVGMYGNATLTITSGGTAASTGSIYGIELGRSGSGTVIVDGIGSTLTSATSLQVGRGGNGTMIITNGGAVNTTKSTQIAINSASNSGVTVNGVGSTWTAASIQVGSSGKAYLSISDGGTVTATALSINSVSTLTTDVGYGSLLSISSGTGTISNSGTIRLVVGAGVANGVYTPMYYGTLTSNTPVALGGAWNDTNHTVTVTAAATGIAGTPTTFDLATTQRVLITDPATGHSVGAAFQAATVPTNLTITASAISDLSGLQGQLAAGKAVLSAWNFDITGTTTSESNPVYLSLFAGPDQNLSTLAIWHYDGSTWSAFTANDLAYDGTYASFTVTGFSGYALSGTAPVPIPAAVWMLGSGLAGLIGFRKRSRNRTVS